MTDRIGKRGGTDLYSTGRGTGNNGPQGTGLALSILDHAESSVGQKVQTFGFCSGWEWDVAMMKYPGQSSHATRTQVT